MAVMQKIGYNSMLVAIETYYVVSEYYETKRFCAIITFK